MSVTKNDDIERYDIRVGMEWATVCISSAGLFMAEGSYGVYGYRWTRHGRESFKHFLVDLTRDPHYAMSKLGKRSTFDWPATKAALSQDLLEGRRDRGLAKEDVRDLYDLLWEMSPHSDVEFYHEVCDHPAWERLTDVLWCGDIPLRYDYSPQLKEFMRVIFPEFVECIRSEIRGESELQKEKR